MSFRRLGAHLACLSVSLIAFLLALQLSPRDAPLVLAVSLTAAACAFDFCELKIPLWIPALMVTVGALYLVASFVQPAVQLESLFTWIAVPAAAFAAMMILDLVGVGDHDIYLIAGIAMLVPFRAVSNIHLSFAFPLFIISVALNAAVIGTAAAFVVNIVRCRFFSNRVAFPPEHKTPESTTRKKIIQVSAVMAFWIVVLAIFSHYHVSELLSTLMWMPICIVSFFMLPFYPLPGAVNGLIIMAVVPRFLALPPYGQYVIGVLSALTVIIIMQLTLDGVRRILNRTTHINLASCYPFAPAILVGILVTILFGDVLLGTFI